MLQRLESEDKVCDICGAIAQYYETTWYIHVCSDDCFSFFVTQYNNEIDQISREKLEDSK